MCSVQVLLLPDVMRKEASAPRNVCRRLFAADGEGSEAERRARFLTAVQRDLEQRDRERWNFNFREGTPLPGRYQWAPFATDSERPCPRRTHKTTTQSKITDFLLQRKRHRTIDDCPAVALKARRIEQQQQHSAAVN